jgi:hypothetical protein
LLDWLMLRAVIVTASRASPSRLPLRAATHQPSQPWRSSRGGASPPGSLTISRDASIPAFHTRVPPTPSTSRHRLSPTLPLPPLHVQLKQRSREVQILGFLHFSLRLAGPTRRTLSSSVPAPNLEASPAAEVDAERELGLHLVPN